MPSAAIDTSLTDTHFDYIITGMGCAGLSLLMRMLQQPFFSDKKILLVDQSPKNKNDRTWCFWEQQPGLFEPIVHHQWKQIDFYSASFSARFDLKPYTYKMIRSIDFYNYVMAAANQHSNIHFYYGNVQSVNTNDDKAVVKVDDRLFTAGYIFNSILFNDQHIKAVSPDGYYRLLQHFKGWLIETATPVFNATVANFMDFRINQQHGTSFVYVLPVSPNKALVEYTLFTESILPAEAYDAALKDYIQQYLKLSSYKITEVENGVIPMTNYPFSTGSGRVVNMGTAGGQTKASSGFTFRFIQKNTESIVEALINQKDPHIKKSFFEKRFNLYDNTLLHILHYNKMGGDEIFAHLFKNNTPQRVLKFLDNETVVTEELKIMKSVPAAVFLPAAFKEMFSLLT